MIIGHVGFALGVSRWWDRVPMGWLMAASFAPDLWRLVLAAMGMGWQSTNFLSHALPASAVLVVAVALAGWIVLRNTTHAVVLGAMVVSHPLLDMISGSKAMWAGRWVGLNLQSFQQLELLIEAMIVLVGWKLVWRRYGAGRSTRFAVPAMLIVFQAVVMAGGISQRPYLYRCLAYPMGPCTDDTWLTKRWNMSPIW